LHVLVTTDTLTGVWTYTRELVTGLITAGARVTLVSLGEIPVPSQTSWMENLHGLDYRPTAFRLEWMQDGERDVADSSYYLESLVREVKPDVLHLGQYCYGSLAADVPRVVVAHGDLISWWISVHGDEPRETRWLRWYRGIVSRGVNDASVVVAPSRWMRDCLRECYTPPRHDLVIYNGRNPIFFNPYQSKDDSILSVGRLWDAGKQVSLLTQHPHPFSVCIVGSDNPAFAPRTPIRADVKLSTDRVCVALKGPQTESQLRTLYSRAAIYAATARYEPFGMTALEAALSRCAIVANDIPTYREIWGDTALYFRTNDADSLAEVICALSANRDLCRLHANLAYQRARDRFNAKRMIDDHLQLYRRLLSQKSAAA
jgi:glycogen(starch) synthase